MGKVTEKEIEDMLNAEQLEFFNSLAQSYRKNFVLHITGAKTENTQLKRIEEVKEALELKCKNIFDYKKKLNPRTDINENMNDIQKIEVYFDKIDNKQYKKVVHDLFFQILRDFKELEVRYAWNQPMITINDSFVLALSVAKNHFSISFEPSTLNLFLEQFEASGYQMLKKGFQIKYDQEINYEILKEAIRHAMENKRNSTSFWEE